MVTTYSEFKPTPFDSHIKVEDREDWIVSPVSQNRDSGALAQSNFAAALEMLGGESDMVEVHRFGWWGPGWFEIILVHPSLRDKVEDIESKLEDYPVLDETDFSERECEAEEEAWDNWAAADMRCELGRVFQLRESTLEWFNDDRLWALYQRYTSGTEHTDEGPTFPTSWMRPLSTDDLARWIVERRREERQKVTREEG